MTGMAIAIASTCYWETDPPTFVEVSKDSPSSGRLDDLRGAIFVARKPGEDEYFEAQLFRDSIHSYRSEPEILYEGPALAEAVRRLNERLDALELEGYVKSPRNDLPTRLDSTEGASHVDRARDAIADHISGQPPEPPQPKVADPRADELTNAQRLPERGLRGTAGLGDDAVSDPKKVPPEEWYVDRPADWVEFLNRPPVRYAEDDPEEGETREQDQAEPEEADPDE